MNSEILVSAIRLKQLIKSGDCTVVDCRFDFSNTNKGRADWQAGHIPSAFYAHLDLDLAARIEDHSGRHPLPKVKDFAKYLASIGWTKDKLLVAYDEGSNAISARLWWMMRYFGHSSALLDGGLSAWSEAGLPLEKGVTHINSEPSLPLVAEDHLSVSTQYVHDNLGSAEMIVLDARAQERYSGEAEYLDTRAGHIPGALNRPFTDNLGDSGRFRNPGELKAQFKALLGTSSANAVVHSCGSGVTACHNLFAMELAGMGASRLYPGSWSEWIRDPARPVKMGNAP